MTDAEIVIPATSNNPKVYQRCLEGVKSCRASTDVPIIVVDNETTEGSELQITLKAECERNDICYILWKEPFSMSKIWNMGIDMTTAKYIAHAKAGAIYFPGWLENIVDLWEQRRHYYFLCTSSPMRGTDRLVQDTIFLDGAAFVSRRDNNYRFDEFFKGWELDADVFHFLQKNSLVAGCVLNSKANNIPDSIKSCVPGLDFGHNGAREYLEKKWNLEPPREQPRYKGWQPSSTWVNPTPPAFLVNHRKNESDTVRNHTDPEKAGASV